jgi:hypothetical protein
MTHEADSTANVAELKAPDPFDPEALRLAPGAGAELGVEKALIQVPVRKPLKHEFFRVDPRENYRLDTALLDLKDDREVYLVMPAMRDALLGEVQAFRLYLAQSRQGVTFMIPVRLPDEDGRINSWPDSMHRACSMAMESWIRVRSDHGLNGYQPYIASGELPEPKWPDKELNELLRLAFQGRTIDREDHPVIRRLYGQV